MKILYIGRERRNAEAVATALRGGIAQNVTLLWAQSLDHVARSLDDHQDLAALVVDAQIRRGGVAFLFKAFAEPPTLVRPLLSSCQKAPSQSSSHSGHPLTAT